MDVVSYEADNCVRFVVVATAIVNHTVS